MFAIDMLRNAANYTGRFFPVALSDTVWTFVGGGFILVVIVFSVNGELRAFKANTVFCVFYFLSAVIVLLSGLDHAIGQGVAAFAAILIILFPCLYFVWANRGDYEVLYSILAFSAVVTGTIFLIASVLVVHPATGERYQGIALNPNGVGSIAATVFICSLYLVFQSKLGYYAVSIVSTPISLFVLAISGSRTSLLVAASAAMICAVRLVQIFIKDRRLGRNILLKILAIVLITGAIGAAGIKMSETLSMAKIAEDVRNALRLKVFDSSQEDDADFLNRVASGRLEVWSVYLHSLDFIGNDASQPPESYEAQHLSAHNNVIEIAWRSGIPAGIAYAGMLLLSIFASIRGFFERGARRDHTLFLSIAVAGYFVTVMFETMVTLLFFPIVLIYYIGIGSLVFREQNTEKATG
jgi:O-antigen ligase